MSFFTPPKHHFKTSALSFDIETLDTRPTAVILSIGACIFDPDEVSDEARLSEYSFYVNVDPASCQHAGLTVSADTVAWWQQQDEAAKVALTDPAPIPLYEALTQFNQFIHQHPFKITGYIANSPSFDAVILQNAMRAVNVPWTLPFWAERDLRTKKEDAWPNGDAPNFHLGQHHNARDDAITQAAIVQVANQRLRLCHLLLSQYLSSSMPS